MPHIECILARLPIQRNHFLCAFCIVLLRKKIREQVQLTHRSPPVNLPTPPPSPRVMLQPHDTAASARNSYTSSAARSHSPSRTAPQGSSKLLASPRPAPQNFRPSAFWDLIALHLWRRIPSTPSLCPLSAARMLHRPAAPHPIRPHTTEAAERPVCRIASPWCRRSRSCSRLAILRLLSRLPGPCVCSDAAVQFVHRPWCFHGV